MPWWKRWGFFCSPSYTTLLRRRAAFLSCKVLASTAETEHIVGPLFDWTKKLTRVSLGNQFSKIHNRWKAARLATNRTALVCPSLASGLRSEYSNRSWLTLAGSSCNWLQWRIRDSITHLSEDCRRRRIRSGLVLEFAIMIGWHCKCSSLSSLRSALHSECNSIQTTLHLLCIYYIHLKRWDEWSNCR